MLTNNENVTDQITLEKIKALIIELRHEKILIDKDVADLYGVTIKEVNQAVANNSLKFPIGYTFELTKEEVVKKIDHLEKLKFSPHLPKAFSEKGLYMLATILKSQQATQTTLAIIEIFSKIRELSRTVKELSVLEDNKDQKSLMQRSGELIVSILDDGLQTSEAETTIELSFA